MLAKVKRRITELLSSDDDAHEAESTRSLPPLKSPADATMATDIQYYPPQMDALAGTSTRALREGPLWLMFQDACVFFKMLRYLPNIILPFKASSHDDELAVNVEGTWELVVQGILFIFETVLLLATPVGILFLPGVLFIPALSLACGFVWLICWPLHGPNVCCSTKDTVTPASAHKHCDERWVFVNGCATNHAGLQKNIDRLAKTFDREVVGIHNKSFGLVADLLECLIQRSFAYKTQDVRIAYLSLKPYLIDAAIKKVVLVGHSQGGLIISLVLDQLFDELPAENMAKLEIYTFGSAASHFSNPSVKLYTATEQPSSPTVHACSYTTSAKEERVIGHIEHYANEYDIIPRWGVLHSICDIQNNRYAGSVFVRMHQSGHMFNQHYMDAMFPLPQKTATASSIVNFLDRSVSVGLELAWKRAVAPAVEANHIFRRATTGLEFGSGDRMLPKDVGPSECPDVTPAQPGAKSDPVMIFSRTTSGVVMGEEASGKTVKDLSRLWRYLGGDSPDE